MGERIAITRVLNVETETNSVAIIRGHTGGGVVEVALDKVVLPGVIASLTACEVELRSSDSRQVAGFHYAGFETRPVETPGQAFLVVKVLPDLKIGFVMSAAELKDLARGCLETVEKMTAPPPPN